MTFWGLLGVTLSSAGLFASILGAFVTYAARKNGEATRELIRSTEEATRELIGSMEERMTKYFAEIAKLLERMDERADERHRDMMEVIRALKVP